MNDYYGLRPIASFETLTLERLEHEVRGSVGAHIHESLKASIDEDIWGGLVYRLTADVLAEKLPPKSVARSEHVTFEFPASTWQMFKMNHAESWWLGWFVREWPVRWNTHKKLATLTVDLERYRTFPQANYVFPNTLGPYVNVAVTRDSLEWA